MPQRIVLDERWDSTSFAKWRLFGIPQPRLTRSADSNSAVFLNGDGDYTTGLIHPTGFQAANGLGLEISAAVPIIGERAQSFGISLIALPDSQNVANATMTAMGLPQGWTDTMTNPSCGIGVPARSGLGHRNTAGVHSGNESNTVAVDPSVVDGSFHRWMIQLLPNGACQFAIDGNIIWTSTRRMDTSRRTHVTIEGSSEGTKVLAGRVKVWTGIASSLPTLKR